VKQRVPEVSVVMPTWGHAAFIRRALESLLSQSFEDWELVIVDDASPDGTAAIVESYLSDERISYRRLPANRGLGTALNAGLDAARAPLLAYLPSDDVYYPDHLAELVGALDSDRDTVAVYSGVRHHYNRYADGQIDGEPLQLVQVMHRAVPDRWLSRDELVTDDLGRMFWNRLAQRGGFSGTGRVTCEWVSHPAQLHATLREPMGGINAYRSRFGVAQPLRYHSTVGNYIDEVERLRPFRERPRTPVRADGLRILLVGELAYNPERVLSLEELGHELFGLWMPEPHSLNTVGPLPFGNVTDVPRDNWQREVRRIRPDVIYALLNWQAVPFAHHVLLNNPGVPFVWHFKEGPFICLEKGTWQQLAELTELSDGAVFSSHEMRDWFETVLPGVGDPRRSLILDGDLPKREWLGDAKSRRLSEDDGEIHTVVPGRPIGVHPHTMAGLAEQGIHLHLYGDFTHGLWRSWIDKGREFARRHLHLHSMVDQDRWTEEFSKYDAGWLHVFESQNGGDIRRADWDDLNLPARIGTFAAAGLPMIQWDNRGSVVATQTLTRELGVGVYYSSLEELRDQLTDETAMAQRRERVWAARELLTFDYHAGRLADFLRFTAETASSRAA
jgi:hypothetical protein